MLLLQTNHERPSEQYELSGRVERLVERIYSLAPSESERSYSCTLVLHKTEAESFADNRAVSGVVRAIYREAGHKL